MSFSWSASAGRRLVQHGDTDADRRLTALRMPILPLLAAQAQAFADEDRHRDGRNDPVR
jgi:hypothetical protein